MLLSDVPDGCAIRFRQGGLVGLERTGTGWELMLLLPRPVPDDRTGMTDTGGHGTVRPRS